MNKGPNSAAILLDTAVRKTSAGVHNFVLEAQGGSGYAAGMACSGQLLPPQEREEA